MMEEKLRSVFARLVVGDISPEEALQLCRLGPTADMLAGLNLDRHRALRTGLGEVVFAQGKADDQLCASLRVLAGGGSDSTAGLPPAEKVLATRVNAAQGAMLARAFPEGCLWPQAGLFALGSPLPVSPPWPQSGQVMVLSAGAADRAVALEAFGTLVFWGIDAGFVSDVGVAGLHRLQAHLPALDTARCIIAVAGMEGALPGVVAGFVRCPVLAVPTSVGYGVGAGGHAALLSMLCSCVPGVSVVNIDNGFGAAAFAAKCLLAGK
ncbi:MAG: nickel pincer cofactor biosynthesis protein LarB [Desulfovibrionaceae bacterium]